MKDGKILQQGNLDEIVSSMPQKYGLVRLPMKKQQS